MENIALLPVRCSCSRVLGHLQEEIANLLRQEVPYPDIYQIYDIRKICCREIIQDPIQIAASYPIDLNIIEGRRNLPPETMKLLEKKELPPNFVDVGADYIVEKVPFIVYSTD